jgi:hypothetical protein
MSDTVANGIGSQAVEPSRLGVAIRTAVPAWLVSRALVLVTLAGTRAWFDDAAGEPREALDRGLRAWDAAYYVDISSQGYDAVVPDGLRFFPLLPLLGRSFGALTPFDASDGIVIVANLVALAAFVAIFRWVSFETDQRTARIAVWVTALAPPAFVLVMGYAESLLILAAASCVLAARRGAWIRAGAWAYVAGLARPTGLLLVVPLVVEAVIVARRRGLGSHTVVAAIAAGGAPLGCLTYLFSVRDLTPSFFTPLRLHDDPSLRGGTRNPVAAVVDSFGDLISGDRFASGIHFVTALIVIVLLVVLWRRAPRSVFAYGAASVMLGLSAHNLDSLERYSLATPPLVLAAALLVSQLRERWRAVIFVCSAVGLVALGSAAFAGNVVP